MRKRHARRGWAFAAAFAVAVTSSVTAGTALPAAPAAAAEPLNDHSVQITVEEVTPSTPAETFKPKPLKIMLTLTNTTDQSLSNVQVKIVRGSPINTQQDLDGAIARPQPPTDPNLSAGVDTADGKPVQTPLGAKAAIGLTFTTATEIPTETPLCLCANAIYPLYITAHTTDTAGNDITIGSAQTYVPSFKDTSYTHVGVSWVWPILDRPHRMLGDTQFLDDELASSVDGGRLDRVLQVAEQVAPTVPLTLEMDPELIDELAVMANGKYQYPNRGKLTDGVGTAVARSWLTRLKTVLGTPGVRVSFTPPGDPDLEALSRAGLTWTATPSQAMQARIESWLGTMSFTPSVVWPVDETAGQDTLGAVARQGSGSVVLDDTTLPPAVANATPAGLATVQTTAGPLTAFVTSHAVERYVASTLTLGGAGLSSLPQLVAEVALRAVEQGSASQYVVITPPRLVNPNIDTATRAITDTAKAFWSSALPLQTAAQSITPSERGGLSAHRSGLLPPRVIDAIATVSTTVPALSSMFSSTDASAILGNLPAAAQRAASAGWQADPDPAVRQEGDQATTDLLHHIDSIESNVQIVKPSSGTYTLASSNSPLPLTIWNRFTVPVTVQIRVSTQNGLPGFTADTIAPQVIAPNVKKQMQIPTHVQRTGRFEVQAELLTPTREAVGDPVELSIRSTALGTIGVVITVVAGAILVLALLVRLVVRWRRRSRTQRPAPVVTE